MFDIKTSDLPFEYIEVTDIWLRGDLGPITIWSTAGVIYSVLARTHTHTHTARPYKRHIRMWALTQNAHTTHTHTHTHTSTYIRTHKISPPPKKKFTHSRLYTHTLVTLHTHTQTHTHTMDACV